MLSSVSSLFEHRRNSNRFGLLFVIYNNLVRSDGKSAQENLFTQSGIYKNWDRENSFPFKDTLEGAFGNKTRCFAAVGFDLILFFVGILRNA